MTITEKKPKVIIKEVHGQLVEVKVYPGPQWIVGLKEVKPTLQTMLYGMGQVGKFLDLRRSEG